MKKPRNMEELLSFIFLCVGSCFILFGVLAWTGIMNPTEKSIIQDAKIIGNVFGVIGVLFCVSYIVLKLISNQKLKKHKELIKNGMQYTGIVEKIYIERWIQFGKQSPYRICYSFSFRGKKINKKSDYLWNKPELKVGDNVVVFLNESGESMLEIEHLLER